MGRPATFTPEQAQEVREKLDQGATVAGLAREYNTTRQTIMRVRAAGEALAAA
jgi:putative DNA-invertase from lambdoid prophage Rac